MREIEATIVEAVKRSKGCFVEFADDGRAAKVLDEAPADFVILAGTWHGMIDRGAMQAKCHGCGKLVGLAPPSQRMVEQNPKQVVLCLQCAGLAIEAGAVHRA